MNLYKNAGGAVTVFVLSDGNLDYCVVCVRFVVMYS